MNKLKLISLKLNDTVIKFKEGQNYIIGRNATGKTTIFNCIKYSLGLLKKYPYVFNCKVELKVYIGNTELCFIREFDSALLHIFVDNEIQEFQVSSPKLNSFLSHLFEPQYLFHESSESIFDLLNFSFMSEDYSFNRRRQWEALKPVCGSNIMLLNSVQKDILALRKEVQRNKELENKVHEFSELLKANDNSLELESNIEVSKIAFFKEFKDKEELLSSATDKFQQIESRSEFQLESRVQIIGNAFLNIRSHTFFRDKPFDGVEKFLNSSSNHISMGEAAFYALNLVLATSQVTKNEKLNFPQLIINDSSLSIAEARVQNDLVKILDGIVTENDELQYIEFTHRKDGISEGDIVFNLDEQFGGVNFYER